LFAVVCGMECMKIIEHPS